MASGHVPPTGGVSPPVLMDSGSEGREKSGYNQAVWSTPSSPQGDNCRHFLEGGISQSRGLDGAVAK